MVVASSSCLMLSSWVPVSTPFVFAAAGALVVSGVGLAVTTLATSVALIHGSDRLPASAAVARPSLSQPRGGATTTDAAPLPPAAISAVTAANRCRTWSGLSAVSESGPPVVRDELAITVRTALVRAFRREYVVHGAGGQRPGGSSADHDELLTRFRSSVVAPGNPPDAAAR